MCGNGASCCATRVCFNMEEASLWDSSHRAVLVYAERGCLSHCLIPSFCKDGMNDWVVSEVGVDTGIVDVTLGELGLRGRKTNDYGDVRVKTGLLFYSMISGEFGSCI